MSLTNNGIMNSVGSMNGTGWPAVPVFYATTEGHTARVATRFAEHLQTRGIDSRPVDLTALGDRDREWDQVKGAVLCASVHYGWHQKAARKFAAVHRQQLSRVTSMFLSVSMAAHSKKARDQKAANRTAMSFGTRTGWVADRSVPVAGQVAFTQYGFLKRFMMKRLAAAEGGSTDTSRDHDYTDWNQINQLAAEFAERMQKSTPLVRASESA